MIENGKLTRVDASRRIKNLSGQHKLEEAGRKYRDESTRVVTTVLIE